MRKDALSRLRTASGLGVTKGMPRHYASAAFAISILILNCLSLAAAQREHALKAEQIPLFRIRARVTETGGTVPSAQSFTFKLSVGNQTVKAQGDSWSPWLDFTPEEAEAALRVYSNRARHSFPIVLLLRVSPVVDPTLVSAQVRFSEPAPAVRLSGDLFGPNLGILVWRDEGTGSPRAATMAGYNQRYWREFDAAPLPIAQRPKHFLIVDRFIGGDGDRLDWEEGISHVAETGITAMPAPPSAPIRSMLLKNQLKLVASGERIVGGPLGLQTNASQMNKWTSDFESTYFEADYKPADFSLFALADEPGWYYPSALEAVDKDPNLLKTFRDYLAQQQLTPQMLGASTWDQVHPIGHSNVAPDTPLSTRRLFYWTCRFFPWKAAEHMQQGTNQLHQASTPELKTFTNWNNFAGQFYFEGLPAKNPNPRSPDAAMGAPDWFEFGQMRATDLLWTEDWFGQNRAYQWSFYAAKLRSIAYKNGLEFGGYVIGQFADNAMSGMVQRALTLVGSGAKALYYYNFGPVYNFPGNCYSEFPLVPAQLAHVDKMIAEAEDVLWPGREQPAQVAILQPRSAEVWDGLHIRHGSRIQGVANNKLNNFNLDYMAEVFDEYLALQMSDIPADFVSEDGLTDGTLNKYKVLYITEPDIPIEGQRAIAEWVKNGGTLAMVPGAGQGDRYDEPASVLTSLAGNPRHERDYIPSVLSLIPRKAIGKAHVFGDYAEPVLVGKVISHFNDNIPAVLQNEVGKGRVIYFSCFPGLSFGRLAIDVYLNLRQSEESDFLRNVILAPVRAAEVTPDVRVDTSYVETPMLVSPAGAAITLLNWTGHDLPAVRVTVRAPFQITSAVSVTYGSIKIRRQGDQLTFALPLGAADIVKLTP